MSDTSQTLTHATPGVYVTEINAPGGAIVGVATAVPVFIGYTQFAATPGAQEPLYGVATQISSMVEYLQYFGGAAPQDWRVVPTASLTPDFHADWIDDAGASSSAGFNLVPATPSTGPDQFDLYWQMQLFFANGGGSCFVISAGSYWTGQRPLAAPMPVPADWTEGSIEPQDLLAALAVAGTTFGATMLVVPEACQLDAADYAQVANAMIAQAALLQDRVAILDLPGCLTADTVTALAACQSAFWTAIAPQADNISYACAYAPALATTIIQPSDFLFDVLASDDNRTINEILTVQANELFTTSSLTTLQSAIAAAFPLPAMPAANGTRYSADASTYPAPTGPGPQPLAAWQVRLDNLLLNALPLYVEIKALIAARLGTQPPSGLLAGVWTATDNRAGVWNAPANVALASVSGPICGMNDAEQGGFNVPVNGMAVNILRAQPNRGTVVWGARTLDGNSLDYRYIQVRRTLIYVEQSIKAALQQFVFAPNDGQTWATVTAMVSNFLTQLWQQGGLMGDKASDAFTVQCGLGSTMTGQDILDGYMVVTVSLQMIHPAEFIELTFKQQMQTS